MMGRGEVFSYKLAERAVTRSSCFANSCEKLPVGCGKVAGTYITRVAIELFLDKLLVAAVVFDPLFLHAK